MRLAQRSRFSFLLHISHHGMRARAIVATSESVQRGKEEETSMASDPMNDTNP